MLRRCRLIRVHGTAGAAFARGGSSASTSQKSQQAGFDTSASSTASHDDESTAGQTAERSAGGTGPDSGAADEPPPMTSRACFEALGLEPATTAHRYNESELKGAYRKAAQCAHPDKPGGSDSRFRNVRIAFDYLKARPGTIASDERFDAPGAAGVDGSGRPRARGFYDHPHNPQNRAYASEAHGKARFMHETRTRWSEEQQRGIYDDPDPKQEFVTWANRWGDAIREGRGAEFLREEREKYRQDRKAEEDARWNHAQSNEHARTVYNRREEAKWLHGLMRLLKISVVVSMLYMVMNTHWMSMAQYNEFHKGDSYPPEYVEKLKQSSKPSAAMGAPPLRAAPGTVLSGHELKTIAEEHNDDLMTWKEDIVKKMDVDAPRTQRTVALRYKGKPFTSEGVREAHAKKGKQAKESQPNAPVPDAIAEVPASASSNASSATPPAASTSIGAVASTAVGVAAAPATATSTPVTGDSVPGILTVDPDAVQREARAVEAAIQRRMAPSTIVDPSTVVVPALGHLGPDSAADVDLDDGDDEGAA